MIAVENLQKLLQTLADANRLKILHCIGEGKCAVSEIVSETQLSQPLVSHHLRTMKQTGLLETARQGPFIYYQLKSPQLLQILGVLSEIAGDIPDRDYSEPMFHCPPWWAKMTKKQQF